MPRIFSRIVAGLGVLFSLVGAATAQPYDLPEDHQRRSLLAEMLGSDPESGIPFDADAQRVCTKERMLRGYFQLGLDPSGRPPAATGRFDPRGPSADPTDVLNNSLDIEVAPPGNSLSGSNTMTIRSNASGLSSFTFRLRWNFTVTACTVNDGDPAGPYTVSPTVPVAGATPASYGRTLSFLRPIPLGRVFTIRVDYSGALQSGIGLGSVFYGGQNGNSANPGVVCTLSEPYYAGTWWPCKDGDLFVAGDNSDKATLNMSITAPDTFASVSNGLLQGIDTATDPSPVVPAGKKRYRWATTYPLSTYLVFFSTSVYNTFTDTYSYTLGSTPMTMPVQFYIYPINDTTANRNAWKLSTQMLATYRTIYGLYPFINEKYGIYQFEFNGGQEHQTFTGQGTGSGSFNEMITSHELGHQWWGDNLTCKTWSDIWLNEGFATYTEALWLERKTGTPVLASLRAAMNARKPSDPNGTVYCYDVSNPGRIFDSRYSYRKAGWVLHMLRRIVGDANYFNTLAAYRAAFEGGAPTTADFTTISGAVSGQDLSFFFQPWLYEIGAPVYQHGFQPATIGGQSYARLMIKQVQTTGPRFDMPIDVALGLSNGTTPRTTVRNNNTDLDTSLENKQYFLIPTSAPVTAVTLDPDNWILEYGKTAVAYVPGPPKIVSVTPGAGSSLASAQSPTTLSILFSDDVTITTPSIAVTRNGSPVSFTLAYSQATQTATLSFGSALPAGNYTVAISDAVVSNASPAIALDGELPVAATAASFPSGNGVPGGAAAYTFTILPAPCPADFNGANGVSVQDLFDFLGAYFAGVPSADFNHVNGVSVQDLFDFLQAYFTACP